MMNAVLKFPEKPYKRPAKQLESKNQVRIKSMDIMKYFNTMQIKLIRRAVKNAAILGSEKGKVTGIREWLVIDLLTLTGIRVSEAADIRCGDLKTGYGQCALYIRNGKGSKSRTIQIPQSLKQHFNQ